MAAPRPKPTALKLITGNAGKRALNKKEPTPARIIPPYPEHLNEYGRIAWDKIVVILDKMGVLTEADGYALERLCDCYADILVCRDLLARDGWTYTNITSMGDTLIKANPAAGQLRAADAQFKSYLIEFGLTPSARSKVQSSNADESKVDPLGQYFG